MKIPPTRKMRELLRDPEARKQLQIALMDGTKTITISGVEYELVPLANAAKQLSALVKGC
jgi:hypothetical protein